MTEPHDAAVPPRPEQNPSPDEPDRQGLPMLPRRVEMNSDSAQRDLAGLVLTIVELLRQLMERQALRRIDEGDLAETQVEQIGLTLMALEERMNELCDHFGLKLSDLNLDLGPLGTLLPED